MTDGVPLISVVIPTYNRPSELARCLKALTSSQTLHSRFYEIIVTDDGNNQTQLCSEFPKVKWLRGPGRGPAANRNCGAREAKGDWLCFLDDDCYPDVNWLESYSREISRGGARVLEGRVTTDREARSLAETAPTNDRGGCMWSCNFAIERGFFLLLTGFNERFKYAAMEDVELRTRIEELGESIRFVADATVVHPWRIRAGWSEFKRHQRSTFIYLEHHPDRSKEINCRMYLRLMMVRLIDHTIPGIFSYRGRGLWIEMQWYLSTLETAIKLASIKFNTRSSMASENVDDLSD